MIWKYIEDTLCIQDGDAFRPTTPTEAVLIGEIERQRDVSLVATYLIGYITNNAGGSGRLIFDAYNAPQDVREACDRLNQ